MQLLFFDGLDVSLHLADAFSHYIRYFTGGSATVVHFLHEFEPYAGTSGIEVNRAAACIEGYLLYQLLAHALDDLVIEFFVHNKVNNIKRAVLLCKVAGGWLIMSKFRG